MTKNTEEIVDLLSKLGQDGLAQHLADFSTATLIDLCVDLALDRRGYQKELAEIDNKRLAGELSDGYHTFNELYRHRHALFMLVALKYLSNAFKTKKNDKGQEWPGWFIVGINTRHGQITYHMPDEYWDKLSIIPEVESNSDYDGHTPNDVLSRLNYMLQDQENSIVGIRLALKRVKEKFNV